MLRPLIRVTVSAICVLAVVLGMAATPAYAERDENDRNSEGSSKTDRARIKIETGKGKADGAFSFLLGRTHRNGPNQKRWAGASNSKKEIPEKGRRTIVLECWERTQDDSCFDLDGPSGVVMLTGPLARAMAVNLVARLRFPAPAPVFGPDPSKNEWRMLAVGFPVWLWTEGPTTVSTLTSSNGFTFRMTARWRSTTFRMGDGDSVTCTAMTKYSASVKSGTASPDCGHVYAKPSLPKGKYQVRAVADWDVAWSVAGFSGVIPAYNEASASIPIGELSALNR
ncbi:MAG: hypothetical protein QM695_05490 [Micropruina sp.]